MASIRSQPATCKDGKDAQRRLPQQPSNARPQLGNGGASLHERRCIPATFAPAWLLLLEEKGAEL